MFVTRSKPYKTGTTPRLIADGPVLSDYGVKAFRFLGIQMVVDLMIAQEPRANDTRSPLIHLIAFIEPPSYDWDRNQRLCAQFEAERRSARRARSDTGGRRPGTR